MQKQELIYNNMAPATFIWSRWLQEISFQFKKKKKGRQNKGVNLGLLAKSYFSVVFKGFPASFVFIKLRALKYEIKFLQKPALYV